MANATTPVIQINEGNVGIGVTDPEKKLEVKSDTTYDGILIDVLSNPEINFRDRGNSDTLIGTGRHGLDGFHIDTYSGNAFFIKGSNRFVGIGTTSPSYKLDVVGEGKVTGKFRVGGAVMLAEPGTGVLLFGSEGGSQTAIYSASSERIRINGSGNVGIGTTAPSENLHIASSASDVLLESTTTGQASRYILKTTSREWRIGTHGAANNNLWFYDNNAGAYRLSISTSGNVGIGTTAPGAKLEVSGGGILISNGQYYTAKSASGGNYKLAAITTGNVVAIGAIDYTSAGTIFAGGDNVSITTGGVAGSSRLKILSNGNVGIGTTTPSAELEVSGSTLTELKVTESGSSVTTMVQSSTSYGWVGTKTNHTMYIGANDGAKITVLTTGNVGIGNTSPSSKVHIGSNSTSGALGIGLQNDQRFYTINTDGGSLTFKDESAAAERMRITSAGDMGLGTTTPSGKLTIVAPDVTTGPAITLRQTNAATQGWDFDIENNTIGRLDISGVGAGGKIQAISMLKASGNVGIGTTSPGGRLQLTSPDVGSVRSYTTSNGFGLILDQYYSAASEPGASYTRTADIVASTGDVSSSQIRFLTKPASSNPAVAMLISGNGNVGIGTTSPSTNFHVSGTTSYGSIRVSPTSTNGESAIAFFLDTAGTTTGTAWVVGHGGWGHTGDFVIGNQAFGGPIILAQQDGKVGIGATAPLANLDISNDAGTTYQQWSYDNPGANNYNLTLSETVTAGNVRFVFDQKNAGTQYSDVLVFNQGKIGVGTDEPEAKLHISGRVYQDGLGNSTFFGFGAGKADDLSSRDNSAFGYQALYTNTTGSSNTATGYKAIYTNTTGHSNTVAGYLALYTNTTGALNTATGAEALRFNTTGNYNTADGYSTLRANTTGGYNTATGYSALYSNTTASYNTASGMNALYANTTGTENAAFGYEALRNTTTAGYNSAFGTQALRSSTTGHKNVAVGTASMYANTTGYANTATGYHALRYNTTGHSNTAVGFQALRSNTTASYNTAVGRDALVSNTTGTNNTATGYQSLKSNTTGIRNTATGYHALRLNTTANYNTAYGYYALNANTTGHSNTANGYQVLQDNTTGGANTGSGFQALQNNTTGTYNTANGNNALNSNTTGAQNVAIGYESMNANISGNYSVGVGFRALKANTASQGTALGYEALLSNTSGANNVAIGFEALKLNTTGADNTAIGHQAGNSESTATKCVFIGKGADVGGDGTSNQIVIGWGAEGNGSNTVTLGDSNTTEGVFAYGAYQEISDQSVKENVVTIAGAVNKVKAMRGVTYNKIGRETTKVGVIAQEMELVLPEVVAEGSGGLKSVAYGNIVAVLIEAMKEQQSQIDDLQQQINNL